MTPQLFVGAGLLALFLTSTAVRADDIDPLPASEPRS